MLAHTRRARAASLNVPARLALISAAAAACVASSAHAADVVRSATGGSLNATTSWVDGVVPGSGDVAVWQAGSVTSGSLGADLSFGGLRIADVAGVVSISGTNILTLGASGIDMSAATQNLNLQPGNTTTPASGINLAASQTWNVAAGRILQAGNGASGITGVGAAGITKTGGGTAYFNNGGNTFSGGVVVSGGAVTFNTNTTTSGGVITSGPLGTGTITLAGGTLSVNTTSGRDLANDVKVTADSTIGLAGTNRVRSAGTWDLGGVQRTLTLTNVGTTLGSGEQFAFIAQGGKTFTLANGDLRFVGGAGATAATPAQISFAQGSGGVFFQNGSTVTLGANVLAFEGSSQTNGGANAPKLTIEAGGVLMLASATTPKTFTANLLSGAGVVATGPTDGVATAGGITIDGASGAATFNGNIQNVYNVFGSNYDTNAVTVSVTKSGGSTQTLAGTNSYRGTTTVSGGSLVIGAANTQLAVTGATTVSGGTLASSVANANFGGDVAVSGTGALSPNAGAVGSFSFAAGKNVSITNGTWAETIASAASFDAIVGNGGAFTATGGTLDLSSSTGINYAASYALVSGFGSVAISGLTITGYDTTNYLASLSNEGVLSFAATNVPEPTTLAALAGVALVARRRRRTA